LHVIYIYSTNIGTEYFKHGIYFPFFSLQNAVCFIILTYLVPVFFTFYIQSVLKLKNNSGAKRLSKEELPEQWKESVILPIYNKGDNRDFINYNCTLFCQLRTNVYPV